MNRQMDEAAVAQVGALLSQPAAQITSANLAAALRQNWQVSGSLQPLGGERDLNFRLECEAARYLVKLAHPAESLAQTEFQTKALLHIAQRDPTLPVSRVQPAGEAYWVDLPEGRLRLFQWQEGVAIAQTTPSAAQCRHLGKISARLAMALQDFDHPAADHALLWDIQHGEKLRPLLPAIADPALRGLAAVLLDHFTAEVLPQLNQLPKQICHSDLNRHNLLIELDNPDHITGILDFGDMVRTPRICDLAVAAAYHFHDEESLPQLVSLVQGYASLSPLTAAELELLPWLMQIRMLASITISSWRAARYPDNARYILRNATAARGGLQAMQAQDPQVLRDELRQAAGL